MGVRHVGVLGCIGCRVVGCVVLRCVWSVFLVFLVGVFVVWCLGLGVVFGCFGSRYDLQFYDFVQGLGFLLG